MRNAGFTFVEILIVMIIMGIIAVLGIPRVKDAMEKSNVRAARVTFSTYVTMARASAVQRGCTATLNMTAGASGTVWVTACPRLRPGAGTVDTLGNVEQLAARYAITLSPSNASVRYSPRGLNQDNSTTTVWFSNSTAKDSVVINQMGKVVR